MEYKIGDKLECIRNHEWCQVVKGHIYTVTDVKPEYNEATITDNSNGNGWVLKTKGSSIFDNLLKTHFKKVEEPKFKVGDKLECIRNLFRFDMVVGGIYDVKYIPSTEPFITVLCNIKNNKSYKLQWDFGIGENNGKLFNLTDYFKKVEEPKYKVGDKLECINGCKSGLPLIFSAGEIYTVIKVEPYFVVLDNDMYFNINNNHKFAYSINEHFKLYKQEKEEKTTMDKFDKVLIKIGRQALWEKVRIVEFDSGFNISKEEMIEKLIDIRWIPKEMSFMDIVELYDEEFKFSYGQLLKNKAMGDKIEKAKKDIELTKQQEKQAKEERRQVYLKGKKEFGKEVK